MAQRSSSLQRGILRREPGTAVAGLRCGFNPNWADRGFVRHYASYLPYAVEHDALSSSDNHIGARREGRDACGNQVSWVHLNAEVLPFAVEFGRRAECAAHGTFVAEDALGVVAEWVSRRPLLNDPSLGWANISRSLAVLAVSTFGFKSCADSESPLLVVD